MPRPPSAFPTDHDPVFPSASPHVAADPAALTAAAARLRGLLPASAPQVGAVPALLDDAQVAFRIRVAQAAVLEELSCCTRRHPQDLNRLLPLLQMLHLL